VTLTALQQDVDAYIAQFKEGYFPPLENLARLTEEVGELARELSHTHGHKKKKAGEAPSSALEEIGDILFVVACLANQLGLSLEDAMKLTLEKYQVRDANRWTPVEPDAQ
jgi:NTP pyrophosphatase (non-canonical NTP hydrolase)